MLQFFFSSRDSCGINDFFFPIYILQWTKYKLWSAISSVWLLKIPMRRIMLLRNFSSRLLLVWKLFFFPPVSLNICSCLLDSYLNFSIIPIGVIAKSSWSKYLKFVLKSKISWWKRKKKKKSAYLVSQLWFYIGAIRGKFGTTLHDWGTIAYTSDFKFSTLGLWHVSTYC